MKYGVTWRDWALSVRVIWYPFYRAIEFHVGPAWARFGTRPTPSTVLPPPTMPDDDIPF